MPHLAERSRVELAVKVRVDAGQSEGFLEARVTGLAFVAFLSQKIDHDRRHQRFGGAQRQVEYGPQMLCELRGAVGFDRMVTAVVRARRDLIDEHRTVLHHEHLDGQHADDLELVRQPFGQEPGRSQCRFLQTRRGQQVLDQVFGRVEFQLDGREHGLVARRGARDDHGDLGLAVDGFLEHTGPLKTSGHHVGGGLQTNHAASVVSGAALLQKGRKEARMPRRFPELGGQRKGRRRDAALSVEELLQTLVLDDAQSLGGRADTHTLAGQTFQRLHTDVLELQRQRVELPAKTVQRVRVQGVTQRETVRQGPARGVRIGIEDGGAHVPIREGLDHHLAELTAFDDAQTVRRFEERIHDA